MPLFHTNLFSSDDDPRAFKSRGVAWTFEKKSGAYRGPPNEFYKRSEKLRKARGHAPTIAYSLDEKFSFDMEILVRARDEQRAMWALNLLTSALATLDGSIKFCPDAFSIMPILAGQPVGRAFFMSRAGLLNACKLSNAASKCTSDAYALHKLALSYRSSSPHVMDLDPREAPSIFSVQADPAYHIYFSNAINLAYSAIEELGLEIRASALNPSKLGDGSWNPKVKFCLETRLSKAGVDPNATQLWTLRGPKTRIEKKRSPKLTSRPSWSRGKVRDQRIQLIDALHHASWLRSVFSAHRMKDESSDLTVYDAHNVQALARRLLMQKFGFW